jgi:hypothetical protein
MEDKSVLLENGIMGHVRDTEHVRAVEKRYNVDLVGYSARWKVVEGKFRTEVYSGAQWVGVFPLLADDLEVY